MNVLTQKVGPLPAWVWGGIAGIGVWFFFMRGKKTPSQQGLTQGTESAYGLGFAQGQQANIPPPAPPPGPTGTITLFGGHGIVWLHASTSAESPIVAVLPNGTKLPSGGPPVQGEEFEDNGVRSSSWVPVTYLGTTAYAWAPEAQGASSGGGTGGAPMRKHGIGSRSSNPWHEGHPLIGAPVKYPHYVKAVGGPRAHGSEIHRVARQAGVHPARIAMLNPTHTGMIRVA